jgi:hypothetical protein
MNPRISRRTLIVASLGTACGGRAVAADDKPAEPEAKTKDGPSGILRSAEEEYNKAKEGLQQEYRKALAKALLLADKVDAILLDFEPADDSIGPDWRETLASKEWFPILPYQNKTKVLKHAELDAVQIKEAAKLMSETVAAGIPGGGAACHFPIHGLRFFKGKELIYYTSLCWVCANFYIAYPDQIVTASWVGFADDALEKWINKLLPIPESELKRFKEKYPRELK